MIQIFSKKNLCLSTESNDSAKKDVCAQLLNIKLVLYTQLFYHIYKKK